MADALAAVFSPTAAVALRRSGLGGSRGVFTTRDVAPGAVLLQEAPFFSLPAGDGGDDTSRHAQLATALVRAGRWHCPMLAQLHPVQLQHLSPEQRAEAEAQHAGLVPALMTEAMAPPGCTPEEALRLVLAVQFNAFDSGMYLALAMVNHGCRPNAAKFAPRAEGGGSEIVAVEAISAGAELTIHYGTVVERAYCSRQRAFRAQHYASLPPSPFDEGLDGVLDVGQGVEAQRLEDALDALDAAAVGGGMAAADEALAYRSAAEGALPPDHLVTTRAHAAVVAQCTAALASCGGAFGARAAALACEGLRSVLALQGRQPAYLGPDNPQCATAAGDEAQLLAHLLSNAPDLLYRTFPTTLGTFSKARAAPHPRGCLAAARGSCPATGQPGRADGAPPLRAHPRIVPIESGHYLMAAPLPGSKRAALSGKPRSSTHRASLRAQPLEATPTATPPNRKSKCKKCSGGSICVHQQRRSWCKMCGGGDKGVCTQGRRRSHCRDYGGAMIALTDGSGTGAGTAAAERSAPTAASPQSPHTPLGLNTARCQPPRLVSRAKR